MPGSDPNADLSLAETDDPDLPPDMVVSIRSKRGKEFLLFALVAMHGGKVTIPMNLMPTSGYTIHVEADDDTITLETSSGTSH